MVLGWHYLTEVNVVKNRVHLDPVAERMISDGTVRPPAEDGMPNVIPDLADDVASLSDLVIADRDMP